MEIFPASAGVCASQVALMVKNLPANAGNVKDVGSIQFCASQVVLMVKNLPANAGNVKDVGSIPGSKDSLEEGMATHSSILAWRISWTEHTAGPESTGSLRVRHDSTHRPGDWRLLCALLVLTFPNILFFLSYYFLPLLWVSSCVYFILV